MDAAVSKLCLAFKRRAWACSDVRAKGHPKQFTPKISSQNNLSLPQARNTQLRDPLVLQNYRLPHRGRAVRSSPGPIMLAMCSMIGSFGETEKPQHEPEAGSRTCAQSPKAPEAAPVPTSHNYAILHALPGECVCQICEFTMGCNYFSFVVKSPEHLFLKGSSAL